MNPKLELGDVQETALIPLACRALETKRKHPRIIDPMAVQIMQELHPDVKKYDKTITHECVVARTILFDETVTALIQKYPNALCINLGCGLDDRYSRVDNQMIIWIDVDFPDMIRVRKKVYEDTNRRKMVSVSVLETDWVNK